MSGRWMFAFVVLAGYGLFRQNVELVAIGGSMVAIGLLISLFHFLLAGGPTHIGGDLE